MVNLLCDVNRPSGTSARATACHAPFHTLNPGNHFGTSLRTFNDLTSVPDAAFLSPSRTCLNQEVTKSRGDAGEVGLSTSIDCFCGPYDFSERFGYRVETGFPAVVADYA